MKPNICKHCQSVNQHFSFQCPSQRKPILPKPNKAVQSTKSSKPISKVSDKQSRLNKAYSVLRKEYMKARPLCMFEGCTRKSEEVHHVRGRIGEYLLDTTEWMAVCSEHHRYIHENDKECRELGYLKSRLGN